MSYDHIGVSLGDLQTASSQFSAKVGELEQVLSQVQSQIESLSSTWQGNAATQFTTLMTQWTSDVQGIREVLAQVSSHLNQAASAYEETDQGLAKGFQIG